MGGGRGLVVNALGEWEPGKGVLESPLGAVPSLRASRSS